MLADYNGATLSAPTITLTNVTARNNDLNGIAIANANTVTLNNVTATNNGTYCIWGSGVQYPEQGRRKLLLIAVLFRITRVMVFELTGSTSNKLFVQTPPTCSGNIWSCYNVSCDTVVLGCMDATAFNYNPSANTDDGSCVAVYGCTDEAAFNFNPEANTDDDPGSGCPGCTDETAFNYNPAANTDDESCKAVVLGCTDETAFNYNSAANTDDGTCVPVESDIRSRSTGNASLFIPVTGGGIA